MKKVLRFLGVLLLIIMAGIIVLGLIAPKDIKIERTITMNAPKSYVADQMFHYGNFHTWNPWVPMDPTVKSEVTGDDGHVGAKYAWKGDKLGKGEMETVEVTGDELKYNMKFFSWFGESAADGTWHVADAGNGSTKATWTFNTHSGFPFNGIMMLFGMEKNLTKSFDDGLAMLKAYTEKHAGEATPSFDIKETQFPGHTYATIRKKLSTDMGALMTFFDESYSKLGPAAGPRIEGPASCLGYGWDEQNGQADLAAAFPVKGSEPVKGAAMVTVDPSPAYMVEYTGGYSGMGTAHMALGKHVTTAGKQPGLVVEEYIKGPGEEKDSTKWETNIYYLVK
jgi:hypothetical protein